MLSTVLLVFSSAMGSYPVPHYLNLTTLCTKYVHDGRKARGRGEHPGGHYDSLRRADSHCQPEDDLRPPELHDRHRQIRPDFAGSISARPAATWSRRSSACTTFFTSYSADHLCSPSRPSCRTPAITASSATALRRNLTSKWWMTSENITENGMYGQKGILYQRGDLGRVQGDADRRGLLRAAGGHNRPAGRLLRQQKPPEQVGGLRQQHGVPAVSDAVAGRRRRVLRVRFLDGH